MPDTARPIQLVASATRAHCMKGFALTPLQCFFLRQTGRMLGISDSELMRRILDETLFRYVASNLFTIPNEFMAFPAPAIRTPTPSKWETRKHAR
jgi:hypothetical protein